MGIIKSKKRFDIFYDIIRRFQIGRLEMRLNLSKARPDSQTATMTNPCLNACIVARVAILIKT